MNQMRKLSKRVLRALALTLMVTLMVGVPALAQGAAADQYSGDSIPIRGTITEISGSVVLVEEDPSDWGDPTGPPESSPNSPKGFFTVTDETEIFEQRGGERVPATFEDLRVGQLVEATYAGAAAASYPLQGVADSIVILENTTASATATPTASATATPTATAAAAGQGHYGSATALPATGGASSSSASFIALVAGILLLAGGLVARRIVR